MSANIRRFVLRAALAAVWIALGALVFVNFRGHTLLVDNRNVEEAGLAAPDLITVSVNNGKGLEFFRGDRDRFSVTGGKHRIRIEFSDGEAPFEGRFALPLAENMYILSIPKLINGVEPFVEPFHTAPEPPPPEEEEAAVETENAF